MCGFAGFYNLQRGNFSVEEKLLERMQQRIQHRGPDSVGMWKSNQHGLGLSMRRLKIIDLSDSGNQPMYKKQHDIVVCFNGEIYNYQSLRTDLEHLGYQFYSASDTEVIIFAYKTWGISCLERFEGIFAIALFDLANGISFLIRDRIGVKPLYFSLQGGVLSFASEIKALWVLPWLEKKINDLAWYHYLTYMVSPAPYTIFEGVYKLPAGNYIAVDVHKRITFHEWYSPLKSLQSFDSKEYSTEDACVARIQELLLASTKKRMVADVPVGAYLSGGLDSSLNVALMSRFNSHIKTFTIAFDNEDQRELVWARQISQEFGTDHHELVITEKDAFDFYERMVYLLDEPLADCVCIPFYYVSHLAQNCGMRVVQVGEGADELFFGYPVYAQYAQLHERFWKTSTMFVPSLARRGLAAVLQPLMASRPLKADVLKNWGNDRTLFWGGALAFSEGQKKSVRAFFSEYVTEQDFVVGQIYPGLQQVFDSHAIVDYHIKQLLSVDPQADIGKQMLYVELKQRLPELLLMRADKMAMAASIEAREPYLDHHLVEFMFNIPLHLRFKHNTTKYLLKKAAQDFLPDNVINRPKIGFAAPTFKWLFSGKYFPDYFQALARLEPVLPAVIEIKNKNKLHRAVQNWVLQQMLAFSQVSNGN